MTATLTTFALYSLVLALIPGPDNLFVLIEAATRGPRAGLWVTLGLCTGLLIHTAAVVLGLAAVLAASPVAFTAIKFVGAGYLAFLAWGAFRSSPAQAELIADRQPSDFQYFRRGIIMNATNPKVAMFFLAFLPQFTDTASGSVQLQLLLLALIFILCTLAVFIAIAAFAGRLSKLLTTSRKSRVILNKLAGVIFLLLAGRLLLQH